MILECLKAIDNQLQLVNCHKQRATQQSVVRVACVAPKQRGRRRLLHILHGEERRLERASLGGLLEFRVHLAHCGEDALHAGR